MKKTTYPHVRKNVCFSRLANLVDIDKDELYQLYCQFKDLDINVISNENWVEMLRKIDDPTLRSQIIDKIGIPKTLLIILEFLKKILLLIMLISRQK